jgi:C-lobe and N-lobe beta barrels of Tf-binding protein B
MGYIMRLGSVSALVLTGFALAACGGGEFGDTTCGTLDITASGPCVAAATPTTGGGTTVVPTVPVPTTPDTSTNTGNNTSLSTGDQTIALEFANLVSPVTTGAVSKLTRTSGSPNTAKIQIDTNSTTNSTWGVPKTMDEYAAGTIAAGVNGTGGVGLGNSVYREYHTLQPGTVNIDEELQVWQWGNSYATQYRDVSNGSGQARRQAWSFGGTAATAMPTGGTATYNGSYGATAKTWNWIDDANSADTLSANGDWQVEGTSNITANFGTGQMNGTLTPRSWTGYRTLKGATGRANVVVTPTPPNTPLPFNQKSFMDDNIVIKGTITGNTIKNGTASLDPSQGWLNGSNPAYAGFFGPGAPTEVTGAFNFVAASPEPTGGIPPINDDRRGFVQESGVFNGQ